MRKALVVGIDNYESLPALTAAEADAGAVARRLRRNADADETPNFVVETLLDGAERVTRTRLRDRVCRLFADSRGDDVLFYFAGHGVIEATGGYLVTHDGVRHDLGLPMQEIVDLGVNSGAGSIVLLLDCCFGGGAGSPAWMRTPERHEEGLLSVLRENMTIIAGALDTQPAVESAGHGLFTAALLDALDGAAANLLGEVTASSIYAHIERRFSPWQQRPVAKSYVTKPTVVRTVQKRISLQELRRMSELFPSAGHKFPLDPDYDPEVDSKGVHRQPIVEGKIAVGLLFKKYRDAGLLQTSIAGEHLYWTAQGSHTVELTLTGKEYWLLAKHGRL